MTKFLLNICLALLIVYMLIGLDYLIGILYMSA